VAIESFRHKGLEELFENGRTRRIGKRFRAKIIELLDILDAATRTRDLTGVSDFHKLKGRRRDEYALRVSGNWRLTFKFKDGKARDVDFEDYH
jgi:proteic killer suppression protein